MEIQEIKQQLTINQVLEHYGLQPNKNKMLNCPFHDDKNPSMQVYPETNTVHCGVTTFVGTNFWSPKNRLDLNYGKTSSQYRI